MSGLRRLEEVEEEQGPTILSEGLRKLDVGHSPPRGLGTDGGQWIYTTPQTHRIGLSQAEYDNIIIGLFRTSYTHRENAAGKTKQDLAILRSLEFVIDLGGIVDYVKTHDGALPDSWTLHRQIKIKDQVTPQAATRKPESLFQSPNKSQAPPPPPHAFDTWQPEQDAVVQQRLSLASPAIKDKDQYRRPNFPRSAASSARLGKDNESSSDSEPEALASDHMSLASSRLSTANSTRTARVTSTAAAATSTSSRMERAASTVSSVRTERVTSMNKFMANPAPLMSPVPAQRVSTSGTVKSAATEVGKQPRASPGLDAATRESVSNSRAESLASVPSMRSEETSKSKPASTTTTATARAPEVQAVPDRGRLLFTIKIKHEDQDHKVRVYEKDDPHELARELQKRFTSTLALNASWEADFAELYQRKLKKMHEKA